MRVNRVVIRMMLGVVLLCAHARVASAAAEIKILCSNGIKAVMEELVPQFEQATKHKIVIKYGLAAVLRRQIDAGEPFDVAVLTPQMIDEVIKVGKIAGDSRTVLARSSMALVIRAGGAKPNMGSSDALKKTLIDAKSITYAKEGASGVFFVDLMQKLALTESLTSKLKLADSGRSEERRVGKECTSWCRSRWSPYH